MVEGMTLPQVPQAAVGDVFVAADETDQLRRRAKR